MAVLDRVRTGEIQGLNVTIPHKQNVIEYMDELSPAAQAIGAVNVIYMLDEKLVGDNTDAPGFLSDLNQFLENQNPKVRNQKTSLVLGAGGGARAVVYALLNDGWEVSIAARRSEQAQELADSFSSNKLNVTDFSPFIIPESSLIVNTTPLGMIPNIDTSPLPENLSLPQHVAVYDLVYNPRETKLVRDARSQGCAAITGLGMLLEQAMRAFELWTGKTPPRDVLCSSVDEQMN